VENPLVKVLADMEFEGIRIDEKFFKRLFQKYSSMRRITASKMYMQAPE